MNKLQEIGERVRLSFGTSILTAATTNIVTAQTAMSKGGRELAGIFAAAAVAIIVDRYFIKPELDKMKNDPKLSNH